MASATIRVLVAVAIVSAHASVASAGYIRAFASARASVSGDADPATPDNAQTPTLNTGYLDPSGTISEADFVEAFNVYGTRGEASYDLSVSVGVLRASAQSEANAAADFVNDPDLFNQASGYVNAALVEWGDELTIVGPPGQPVQIRAAVVLTASGGVTEFTTADTWSSLRFDYHLPGQLAETLEIDDLRDNSYRFEDSAVLELLPGTYNISSSLSLATNAVARINSPGLWKTHTVAGIDAGNTGRMFLDVLTPGASYTLASGADLRAVPEPASLLLAATGLGVLAGLRRRPRRKGRCGDGRDPVRAPTA